ncbi:hypothetical protein ACFWUZ_34630 [Streptomyces sp. NPDC058646]|uniref:hypothetical protein n=1 Tax=Streptomyces sp. NPDC058646 TaxID=3346574 RepID=UPI0036486161
MTSLREPWPEEPDAAGWCAIQFRTPVGLSVSTPRQARQAEKAADIAEKPRQSIPYIAARIKTPAIRTLVKARKNPGNLRITRFWLLNAA